MKTTRLLVLITVVISFVSLHAEEFTVNSIKYNGDEATMTATIVGTEENFDEANVVIPEIVNGYAVISVGEGAFRGLPIVSISLPSTLRSIGHSAFHVCHELEKVDLPEGIEMIDSRAFWHCDKLKEISFPNSISFIGGNAFGGCSSLEVVSLPSSLSVVEEAVFVDCKGLTTLTIPNSVTTIKNLAFANCESLKSLFVPSSVTSIEYTLEGEDADTSPGFSGCVNLESIVVDANNPVYDSRSNCNALIRTADNKLIIGCKNSIIPDGVETIGGYAFENCAGLQSLQMPSSIKVIRHVAFSGCGLKSIEIPASVELIEPYAFENCIELKSATIIASLENIPMGMFLNCELLESVSIPTSVISIGNRAFSRCRMLKSIELPHTIETIGTSAFSECSGLQNFFISESVTSIKSGAFRDCTGLSSVTSLIKTPFAVNESCFAIYNSDDGTYSPLPATLYVPNGCKEKYKSTSGWNQFKTILEEGEVLGDVNGDGTVDTDDVICVTNYILGKAPSPFNESVADMTGNGVVDIEDVTSLVDIILSGKTYGYFYFGTTEPTAENFTSLSGAVASYTSINEAVGATASVDGGQTVYMLCPAAWMKGKHVLVEDGEGNTYDFVEDTDAGAISGYVIYRTQAFNEATDAILKFNNSSAETYYWYVGQTNPSSIDTIVDDNDTSSPGWRRIGDSLPTYNSSNMLWNGATNNITFGSRDYYYLALPSDSIKLYNSGGDNEMDGCTSLGTKDFDGVTYYIYKRNVKAMAFGFNIY